MSSQTRIIELSTRIASETAKINEFLAENNLPTPSLDADSLPTLPIPDAAPEIKAARLSVISACEELKALLTGPKELLNFKWTEWVSVKVILRFNIDKSFPVGESSTFEAISKSCGLNVMNVRRIVRHAIINHRIFREDQPGVISHSGLSAVLAKDERVREALAVGLDEFWPAGMKVADALEKWPNSEENNETGFALANNSTKSMWDIFNDNPSRRDRFSRFIEEPENNGDGLLTGFNWTDTEIMVDVGGSHGSVAILLAQNFPDLRCVVQDLPDVVAEGEVRLPDELNDRVRFMPCNFFNSQPVVADVYYFRSIFHNWADKYYIKILQSLVPALRPGARIIIHERVLPGMESLDTLDAKRAVNLDIGMLQLLNAQQRELHEWKALLGRADPRFHCVGAHHPEGAVRWIIEAEWRG